VIRESTPADDGACFAVVRSAFPDFVTSEAGFVHRQVSPPPEARLRAWVAEVNGRVVGWSRGFTRYEESSGSGQINLSVLPEFRRRGIGSALLARVLAHLDEAPRVFAFVTDEGASFAERHGFHRTQTVRVSSVDPRGVDTTELDTTDVELKTVAEVGPEQAFAVESVAALDVPADEPPDGLEYEQWLETTWRNPDFDFGSSYAACLDGRAVAVSYTAVDYPGARAANAFTGVLPDYRGRGLARLVKLAVIRRVVEQGVVALFTHNDERNAPMLAVNERLGFRPRTSQYTYLLERSGNGLRAGAATTSAKA
jgi:GNAT superfamily N-acetyltransferase